MAAAWALAGALLVPACFSQDDFRPCRSDRDCGGHGACTAGACQPIEAPPPGDAETGPPEPDAPASSPADIGPLPEGCPGTLLTGNLSGTIDCTGQSVVVRDLVSADPEGAEPRVLHIIARRIEVVSLSGTGAGERGGGGGGGGGGAVNGAQDFPAGGAGGGGNAFGTPGERGSASAGLGGDGGRGGGVFGGAGGRHEHAAGAQGAAGEAGRILEPDTEEALACDPTRLRAGGGGGGGAGGAGQRVDTCSIGPGGGGGGAGAPGGGLLALTASDEIVVRGPIEAKAGPLDTATSPEDFGHDACGGCGEPCGPLSGLGADGAPAGTSGSVGTSGGATGGGLAHAGSGGDGGPGSGGTLMLRAPLVRWEAGASVDLSGGLPDNGGIYLLLADAEDGEPPPIVATWICPRRDDDTP